MYECNENIITWFAVDQVGHIIVAFSYNGCRVPSFVEADKNAYLSEKLLFDRAVHKQEYAPDIEKYVSLYGFFCYIGDGATSIYKSADETPANPVFVHEINDRMSSELYSIPFDAESTEAFQV